MRMFVAAIPPDEVIEDLDEFWSVRREAGGFRWTVPEQWHVTLAFLAEVPDRRYDDLTERLAAAAAKRSAIAARVVGAGAFPDPARAKVLWAGLETEEPDELDLLANGCRTAAATAGIEVAGERFRPHLTLARTGHPVEATRWLRVGATYRGPAYRIEEVALVASHLGEGPRRRPRYEVLEHFRLRSVPQ